MAELRIHGNLHVTIFGVDSLKYDGTTKKFTKGFVGKGPKRLYATIDLDKARVGRTSIIQDESGSPQWDQSFHIYCAHQAGNVVFSVKIDKPIGATPVGRAYVAVKDLLDGQEFEGWLWLVNKEREPIGGGARIRVKLQYSDVSHDPNWARGIGSRDFPGVPHTHFRHRKGCKVTLYQDAHVPDTFVPRIPLDGGQLYQPHRCWEDIFDAINNAKYLIYITGWSVYTDITLIRDSERPKPGGDKTLGQLLMKKASDGVKVLMLVWDDRTSSRLLKNDGLTANHDEETLRYFDGSDVKCVRCPRNPDNGRSIVQGLQTSVMFTHHQKTVVVDSPLPGGDPEQRTIVSFVGGIDLCDGRYDTQFHSLFRTLDSVHHADFHQPNFTGGAIDKGGPREPWHDIHCKLEGPVAWDVLYNFEQRWKKQGSELSLLPLKKYCEMEIISPSSVTAETDQETWNVQLFRSIDGGAAFGFPETPKDAAISGLVSGKDTIMDRSIQDAYINAIRRAKDFIYIENQYFLGSSYGWKPDKKVKDIGALHLIPKELSLKIVSKIEAGEEFRVYIVVPMWPEGLPDSEPVQAILDWQRRTMEMMYTDIARALRAKGIDADPKDYLSFFCLANREVKKSGEYIPQKHPKRDSHYKRAQENRRFMIYVHSKMMIVDDEYIIIGSANINQRSMDGARDSEIAMGAYQPYRLAVNERVIKPARGQIHGFRMSLWYEHTGLLDPFFFQPKSLQCIEKVNKIAKQHWDLYISESLERDLPGHLLMYPVDVTYAGEVTELPGAEFFPDTKAPVLGAKSPYLPAILTT